MTLTLAAFGALDWAILAGYMLLVLALGYWASRGQEDEESYFLGGRQMPTWAVTLSIVATSLSAATYVGVPQQTFVAKDKGGDLSYLILNIGGILGAMAVAVFLLPPLYRAGTTTIYGALAKRFGPGGGVAASTAFLFGRLLASGARLFMAGIAFSVILAEPDNPNAVWIAIVVFGVAGTAYTCMGGIKAVIWTDTIQILLVVGAGLAAVCVLVDAIPLSVGQIVDHLEAQEKLEVFHSGFTESGYDWKANFTIFAAFAILFQNAGSYGCDQDLVQRMMTTKSPLRASLSLVFSQAVAIPVVLMFAVIGLLLSIYYDPGVMGAAAPPPIGDQSGKVYPQFLANQMPAGLAGLAMVGMFAAAMSSLDSAVNAMAASFVSDIWQPLKARYGSGLDERAMGEADTSTGEEGSLNTPRTVVVVTGLCLTGFALAAAWSYDPKDQSLIVFALSIMTYALSGLLGVFVAALYTKRGNVYSMIAGLVTGVVVIVILKQTKVVAFAYWMAIASPLSFLVAIIPRGPGIALAEAEETNLKPEEPSLVS